MKKLDIDQFHQLLRNLKIYDKFNDDNKGNFILNFEEFLNLNNWEDLIKIIQILNYLNSFLEQKLIYQVEENLIGKDEYCNFINEIGEISDTTINYVSNSNFNFDYGFNENIQEKMYNKGYYLAYIKTKTLYNNNFIFEQNKLSKLEESYLNLYSDVDLYNKYYKYIISCKPLLEFYKSKKIYRDYSENYLEPFSFIQQDYDYVLNEIDEIKKLDKYILNLNETNISSNEWKTLIEQYVDKLVQISDESHIHLKQLLPTKGLKIKINSLRQFRRK